jgi:hypothetical protein
MTCRTIVIGPDTMVIACTRGRPRQCACGNVATLLCDFPLSGEKIGKTCDAPLCAKCAKHVGPDRDYSPAHGRPET